MQVWWNLDTCLRHAGAHRYGHRAYDAERGAKFEPKLRDQCAKSLGSSTGSAFLSARNCNDY